MKSLMVALLAVPTLLCAQSTTTIIDAGPHHRTWQTVEEIQTEDGVLSITNEVMELAMGLNRLDLDGKSWIGTDPRIEVSQDGLQGFVKNLQYQVTFAASPAANPAVEVVMSDGGRMATRIFGLAFVDGDRSVLIAEVRSDPQGTIGGPFKNELTFENAFDSGVDADLIYRVERGSFSQNLLIKGGMPTPQEYGLSDKSILVLLTECTALPPAAKETRLVQEAGPDTAELTDDNIDLGAMKFADGRAFGVGLDTEPMLVAKSLDVLEGRTFLQEKIPWNQVAAQLEKLPAAKAQGAQVPRKTETLMAALKRKPVGRQAQVNRPALQMVQVAQVASHGLLLDYDLVVGSLSSFTWRADKTYWLSGAVSVTNNVFEAGSVLKYTNGAKLTIAGSATWQGPAGLPVVMTGIGDLSVGEKIGTNSALVGYYATAALEIASTASSITLQDFRICHAQTAISVLGATTHTFSHVQLVNCANGISGISNTTVNLRNALFHNVKTNFLGSGAIGNVEHLTVNMADQLNKSGQVTLNVTNSLLVGISSNLTMSSVNCVTTNNSTNGVFAVVGSGYNYLTSSNKFAGTSGINTSLAKDLVRMTVDAPLVLTNHFTSSTNLNPQAARDTTNYWRGYHYWPLDYCWTALNLTNCTLTLSNGVAIGVYGNKGTTLRNGAKFYSEGSPTNFNRLVRYNVVQEQPVVWGSTTSPMSLINLDTSLSTLPELRLRFTDVALLADSTSNNYLVDANNYNVFSALTFTDCQLRSCQLYQSPLVNASGETVAFTNNLALRSTFTFYQGFSGDRTSVSLYLRNNLFRYGSFALNNQTNYTTWEVKDNLFDSVTLTTSLGAFGKLTNSYNGYYSTTALPSPTTGNKTLYSVDYQTGTLGTYYYPTNGTNLNNLRDAGSRTADLAGLYHYTTTTNQVKEGTSTNDIGFHYVATDSNGNPMDTDGDGLPDYLEDRNGNGTLDNGESSFTLIDTDYDGRNDYQEYFDGTTPDNAASVLSVTLGYWRFNTNTWVGEQGQVPLYYTNLYNPDSWNGKAVLVDSNSVANLKYRDVEANNLANFNARNGTVRFWFRSDWNSTTTNSGTGPQNVGHLISLGTKDTTNGYWGLWSDTNGTLLSFVTQTNGAAKTNLTATISWTSNYWHHVVLTYSPSNSALYLDYDGTNGIVTNGLSIAQFPNATVRAADGFSVGSNKGGTEQVKGQFDELKTFNYPLTASQARDQFWWDSDGDGIPDVFDIQANDPNLKTLVITIDNPANGGVY